MTRPRVVFELDGNAGRVRDLAAGGAFVLGLDLPELAECELVVQCAGRELTLAARVVMVGANGVGLEVVGFSPAVRERIKQMASPPPEPVRAKRPSLVPPPPPPPPPLPEPEPEPDLEPEPATTVTEAVPEHDEPAAPEDDHDEHTHIHDQPQRDDVLEGDDDGDGELPGTATVISAAPMSDHDSHGGFESIQTNPVATAVAADPDTDEHDKAIELPSTFAPAAQTDDDDEPALELADEPAVDVAAADRFAMPALSDVESYELATDDDDAELTLAEDSAGGENGETAAEEKAARNIPLNVYERIRGLNQLQQIKMAQNGETTERIVLERIYGKGVWEPLLRNPRLTGPEVARIARMGQLPRPLVEIIVGNGTWLKIPEVRRALLTNPRLGTDQVLRVLRLLPKHELKLAQVQTAYPSAVREAARRLSRGADK